MLLIGKAGVGNWQVPEYCDPLNRWVSVERPGGLAPGSHAAASRAEIDEATGAVNVVAPMGSMQSDGRSLRPR